jgi:glutamine amidotransferase
MAMQRTLRKVLQVMAQHQVREPLRLSAALSDGERIWAFRFSSDQASPTLYFGSPALSGATTPEGMVTTIASEPSDNQAAHWHAVPEGGGLVWEQGRVRAFELGNLPD